MPFGSAMRVVGTCEGMLRHRNLGFGRHPSHIMGACYMDRVRGYSSLDEIADDVLVTS